MNPIVQDFGSQKCDDLFFFNPKCKQLVSRVNVYDVDTGLVLTRTRGIIVNRHWAMCSLRNLTATAMHVNADLEVNEKTLSITTMLSPVGSLSYAVGTSTGTLLYDNREAKLFTLKDQGYRPPVRWHWSQVAAGWLAMAWLSLSIKKSQQNIGPSLFIKPLLRSIFIHENFQPAMNFASITPESDLNDVHQRRNRNGHILINLDLG